MYKGFYVDEVPNIDKEVLKKLYEDAMPKISCIKNKKPIITAISNLL